MPTTPCLAVVAAASFISISTPVALAQCQHPGFAPGQYVLPWSGTPVYILDTRDFNADGISDILAGRQGDMNNHWTVHALISAGGGGFTPALVLESHEERLLPALGDLNADGAADLVIAHSRRAFVEHTFSGLSIRMNDGTGVLGAPVSYRSEGPHWSVELGPPMCIDINADGLLDVAYTKDWVINLRFNLGAGALGPEIPTAAVGWPHLPPLMHDLTGDGLPEIVEPGQYRTDDGSGAFQTVHPITAEPMYNTALIDVDADGDMDISCHSYRTAIGAQYELWLNDGRGQCTAAPTLRVADEDYSIPTFADFDGDNDLDLAVAIPWSDRIDIYQNVGGGEFLLHTQETGHSPWRLEAADLNADGWTDIAWPVQLIVIQNEWRGGVAFKLGRGDGTFEAAQISLTEDDEATFFHEVRVVDVTGDGTRDAVMSTAVSFGGTGDGNGALYVMGGECPCPADFNADGSTNSQDFFDFIATFFSNDPAADFNRDGSVNSRDFFDFLAAFFAECR